MAGAVGELARVLEPGGRALVAVVHPLNSAHRIDRERPESDLVLVHDYFDRRWCSDEIERDGPGMTFKRGGTGRWSTTPTRSRTRASSWTPFARCATRHTCAGRGTPSSSTRAGSEPRPFAPQLLLAAQERFPRGQVLHCHTGVTTLCRCFHRGGIGPDLSHGFSAPGASMLQCKT